MSKIAEDTVSMIKQVFPHETFIEEYYVNYKGQRLFFDLYIKSLNVLVEIQGQQHFNYVSHFHASRESFFAQKRRDNLKIEYCELNNKSLVFFYDKKDKITGKLVIQRIYEALDE